MNLKSQTDLAYAAGVFDADGCLVITNVHEHKGKKYYAARPVIIGQSEDLMQWLQDRWGGRVYNHPGAYNWRPSDSQEFVEDILEYLIVKKDIALLSLEFWAAKRGSDKSGYAERSKVLNGKVAKVFHEAQKKQD